MHEDARAFLEESPVVTQMFDYFECDDEIEGVAGEGHRSARGNNEAQAGDWVSGSGERDRFRGHIEARDRDGGLRELSRSVAGTAARIQSAASFRITPGICVARYVFAPQIVVHVARNYAFARKFNQRLAPRG